jgi:activator of 2-hydroxyglutaryl-CoA dehydratase
MMSAVRWVPDADVVCDIGGQDIKVSVPARGQTAAAT